MVSDTHTIIDPWTVMVKALNTSPAKGTMPRTICPDDLAVRTQKDWIKDFHHGL
jgi:hypothetical protein